MLSLFQIQLLTSFFVGGGLIALISLLAERATERTAGIIVSIPSTSAIGFLFISWALGPQTIPEVVPVSPVSMVASLMYVIVYIYLAKFLTKRRWSKLPTIAVSVVGGLMVWALMLVPLALIEFSNLGLGILIFLVLSGLGYYILTHTKHRHPHPRRHRYNITQKLLRALFAGTIITTAVYLAKTLGPVWGGAFSGFPAVFTSTLVVLHWYYNPDFLFGIFREAPVGMFPSLVFLLAAMFTFPAWGTLPGLLAAYALAMIPFGILIWFELRQ